ncbi:MAG: sensor histidine kinase [Thermodesulfovibrionales bacterium]
MRTKLFAAFILVISIALLSNIVFQWLIMRDFDDYVRGVKEDHLYWVLASVEGSYLKDKWDMNLLNESVHWAMMLGFDVMVKDNNGEVVTDSHSVMESLPEGMKHRMSSIINIHSSEEKYEAFPLFIGGHEIGTMYVRPITIKGTVRLKEEVFKNRGRHFLIISFLIAGLGAIAMAIFLSLNLTRPLRRLKEAAERIAEGKVESRIDLFKEKRAFLRIFEKDEVEKLSESFAYMARTLEKEEMLRKRLTSNIAHELRTPLTIMKANVEALLDGVVSNFEAGLNNIKSEIERLQRLIEGIEDIAKAEASFIKKGEATSVNLGEFLNNIVLSMKSLFNKKGLYLRLEEKETIDVITDVDKIESIIRNIISNSLKYTEQGGIVIDYGKEGDGFYIEVIDTGIGIEEEDLDKVFRRFYSSEDNYSFGLGLAIVKELVEVMDGRIVLKSKPGQGTTFRVELPNLRS